MSKIGSKICEKCGAELITLTTKGNRERYWCRLCEDSHFEDSTIGKGHIQYKGNHPSLIDFNPFLGTIECPECGYSHQVEIKDDKQFSNPSVAPIQIPHLQDILRLVFLFSLCSIVIAGIIVIFRIEFPWPIQGERPWNQGGAYVVEFPWIIVGAIMIFALVGMYVKKSVSK